MKYITLLLIISFVGCKDAVPSEFQIQHDAVMAVHDEVMPKMRDINRAKKALRAIKDPSLDSLVNATIQSLDDADEAMMAWMAQFKKPDTSDPETARQYYSDQMKSIEEVKETMLSTIATAQEIVDGNTEE